MKERGILFSAPMVRAILDGRKSQTRRMVKGMALDWLAENMFTPEFVADPANAMCPYGVPGDRLYVREKLELDEEGWVYAAGGDSVVSDSDAAIDWRESRPVTQGVCSSIHMPRWASRITLEITGVRVQRLQEISEEDAIAEGLPVQMGDGGGPGAGYKWDGSGYWDCVSRNEYGPTYHFPRDGFCPCKSCEGKLTPAIGAYKMLWDSINGPKGPKHIRRRVKAGKPVDRYEANQKRKAKEYHPWASNPWVWVLEFKRIEVPDAIE